MQLKTSVDCFRRKSEQLCYGGLSAPGKVGGTLRGLGPTTAGRDNAAGDVAGDGSSDMQSRTEVSIFYTMVWALSGVS